MERIIRPRDEAQWEAIRPILVETGRRNYVITLLVHVGVKRHGRVIVDRRGVEAAKDWRLPLPPPLRAAPPAAAPGCRCRRLPSTSRPAELPAESHLRPTVAAAGTPLVLFKRQRLSAFDLGQRSRFETIQEDREVLPGTGRGGRTNRLVSLFAGGTGQLLAGKKIRASQRLQRDSALSTSGRHGEIQDVLQLDFEGQEDARGEILELDPQPLRPSFELPTDGLSIE